MKKTIALILVLVTAFALSACGEMPMKAETPQTVDPPATTKPPVPAETINGAATDDTSTSPGPAAADIEPSTSSGTDAVVVDLTQLSSTMVYSEVYAMMYEPEEYRGKTVKMRGMFSSFKGESGQIYNACIVQDATACCAQGLEFELVDGYDYPESGTQITVIGNFDTYQEESNGNYYIYIILRDAKLV